ncbi:DUF3293 domain-containing protein [Vibrio sp. SCSIO 43135]|uniref:DUF3293 domain-containing protein n=1 Tax=Vibrio sp. SCSIO 43135 TaxID=2819096 RepID=UPI00218BBA56|nr:DUF3293 domain-containing protein [Vibrio sp. SCSIO 43135]
MMIDAYLWEAYSDCYFRFSNHCTEPCFAIVTAWDPASKLMPYQYNFVKNQHLQQSLNCYSWTKVLVGDQQFSWSEESFAVAISSQKAVALGKQYQQNAVYYVEHGELFLLSCLKDKTVKHLGKLVERCV